jgi:hypothetical protein
MTHIAIQERLDGKVLNCGFAVREYRLPGELCCYREIAVDAGD